MLAGRLQGGGRLLDPLDGRRQVGGEAGLFLSSRAWRIAGKGQRRIPWSARGVDRVLEPRAVRQALVEQERPLDLREHVVQLRQVRAIQFVAF